MSRLPNDSCGRDWVWDREVETASQEDVLAMSAAAWESQRLHLADSAFYREKLGGVDVAGLAFADLARLPFTTKAELKAALDAEPPFGANLCVPPAAVKRVYQTSGTTGTPSVIALTPADVDVWTQIGARHGIPHGVTSCLLLPQVLAYRARLQAERMPPLADALGGDPAEAVAGLVERLDLPRRISSFGLTEDDLRAAAGGVGASLRGAYPVEDVLAIYRAAF